MPIGNTLGNISVAKSLLGRVGNLCGAGSAADVLSGYFRALDQVGNILEEFEFTVVCEHHEDWAIVRGDAAEIVSGKHRKVSVGAFQHIVRSSTTAACCIESAHWMHTGGQPPARSRQRSA